MNAETVEIKRVVADGKGEYIAETSNGEKVGALIWAENGNVRIAEHTIVEPAFRGRGIAGKLVEALIEDARAQGFKIVPQCAYVAAAFERHPEWQDLRAS